MIRDRQVDVVITWHMDRMCRRVADLIEIAKLCGEVRGEDRQRARRLRPDLPIGQMFATILIAVAE